MSRRTHLAGPLLVTLALLAGCNEQPIADGGAESPAPASPGVEETGPEEPAPPVENQPTVKIANLPVGNNNDGSSRDGEVEQCVGVSWLGDPIPGGVSVTVTGVGFSQEGAFSTDADLRCPGRPCVRYTFDSRRDTTDHFCSVAVRAEEAEASADLILRGSVRCRTARQTCDVFVADAEAKDTSASVTGPDELPGNEQSPDPGTEEAPPGSADAPAGS